MKVHNTNRKFPKLLYTCLVQSQTHILNESISWRKIITSEFLHIPTSIANDLDIQYLVVYVLNARYKLNELLQGIPFLESLPVFKVHSHFCLVCIA